jgi:uncharacterized protein YdaU (DUF1376 family)
MNKAPAFPMYARDWLVDTAGLTLEQQGAYVRLLSHQWIEGPLPDNEKELARRLAVTVSVFRRLWGRISEFFPSQEDGRLGNPRLEQIRREQQEFHEMRSKFGRMGAEARWATKAQPMAEPMTMPTGGLLTDQSPASASASAEDKKAPAPGVPPPTANSWVKALGEDWSRAYAGLAPHGQIGKSVKPLVELHGLRRVQAHWRNYLAATDAKRASPAWFAQQFGAWETPQGSRPQPTPKPPTTKTVAEPDGGGRMRLVVVPIDDPRPAV